MNWCHVSSALLYLSIRLSWPVTGNLLRRGRACQHSFVLAWQWLARTSRCLVSLVSRPGFGRGKEREGPGRRDPGEDRRGEPRAQPEDCAPGSPARDQETMVSVSLRRLGAVTAGTSANSIDTRLLNLLDKGCHIILQLEHLLPKSYLAPLQTKSKVCVRGCYVKLYMYICIYMEK